MSGPGLLLLSGIGDFFNSIMSPLYSAISFLLIYAYRFWSMLTGDNTGVSWMLGIMTLTVVVRTLLIPLFVRQINSARNMQLIQPKMKELQDKYGADRQRLGIETQKLMKAEGVNPMASCFPMFLQMPIFIALYQVLYRVAHDEPRGYFFEKNPDLVHSLYNAQVFGGHLADHFWMGSDWSGFGATQVMSLILVLMMTGLFFITQKQLTGKNMPPESKTGPMAQQQKMMLYMFPIMYLFMGLMIPVGVLVYWVTNNLWTMGQQWLLIRNNPTPNTPAYIEWEERMIAKGRDPKQIAEERRAKRSKTPTEATGSRQVTGGPKPATEPPSGRTPKNSTSPDGTSHDSTGGKTPDQSDVPPSSPVARQQIQRQQPSRQSRSGRAKPKKKN